MKPHYYVYRINGGLPSKRHDNWEEAQQEAERLAAKHPGCGFEILKCIGLSVAEVPKPKTTWTRGDEHVSKPDFFKQYAGKPIGL